jgi:tetratricopeptide (TPR) repeat protein
MNKINTQPGPKIADLSKTIKICNSAKRLEDSGEYLGAARTLGKWWRGVGVRPDVDELSPEMRAVILSRVGALSGWLGSMQQIDGSLERAKELISEGADLFASLQDYVNCAETRSDLAVCFWREGAFDDARVILEDILNNGKENLPYELYGKILLRAVNVEISTKHYEKALYLINKTLPLVGSTRSNLLRGKLYFHRALIFRSLAEDEIGHKNLVSAISDYNQAKAYYKRAKHDRYVAMVENNLGYLYLSTENFNSAHLHLDNSLKMYGELKDKGRAALVYDNKARTYIAQDKLGDAELAAMTSVNMLREGGENSTLAESLTTLGVVLSRGGNVAEAIGAFSEAKETALIVGDVENAGNAVLTQLEELHTALTPLVFRSLYLEADDLLRNSPKVSTVRRLQKIARRQFEAPSLETSETDEKSEADRSWEDFSLSEAVRAYEEDIITRALNVSGGRVTKAAMLLGMSHQNLSLILRQRHKELKQYCVPRKPRSRSRAQSC